MTTTIDHERLAKALAYELYRTRLSTGGYDPDVISAVVKPASFGNSGNRILEVVDLEDPWETRVSLVTPTEISKRAKIDNLADVIFNRLDGLVPMLKCTELARQLLESQELPF